MLDRASDFPGLSKALEREVRLRPVAVGQKNLQRTVTTFNETRRFISV
jgi:hypothetical protein